MSSSLEASDGSNGIAIDCSFDVHCSDDLLLFDSLHIRCLSSHSLLRGSFAHVGTVPSQTSISSFPPHSYSSSDDYPACFGLPDSDRLPKLATFDSVVLIPADCLCREHRTGRSRSHHLHLEHSLSSSLLSTTNDEQKTDKARQISTEWF